MVSLAQSLSKRFAQIKIRLHELRSFSVFHTGLQNTPTLMHMCINPVHAGISKSRSGRVEFLTPFPFI